MGRIAIVGAGPAGMAAAASAVAAGCEVMLIDEGQRPGGQIFRQAPAQLSVPAVGTASEIRRKAAALGAFGAIRERIDYRPLTTAHSLYPGPELQIATDSTSERIRPDAVILATGVSERCVPFPGWTLPGVLYAGGLQALMKSSGIIPGKRIILCGAGVLPLAVGAQLAAAGVAPVAIALLHPLSVMMADPAALLAGRELVAEGLQLLWRLRRQGVPVLQGWAPVQAEGRGKVEEIMLAPVNGDGRHVKARTRRFAADLVAVNYGFTANSELARMAGASCRHDPDAGGWLANADRQGRTSLKGIYVAGDGAGLRGAFVAEAEGRLVGAAAAADVLKQAAPETTEWQRARSRHERFQQGLRRTLRLPAGVKDWAGPDTVICRCENITRAQVEMAVHEGHRTLDAIKRNTRAGMGWCGGRTCLRNVAAFCGASDQDTAPMRARPVARPVKLGALADGEH
jgi:NADPH-dependent 2,4-dienoyl-CoA reductase/sulfur reductase-like enzyme/bacterioferritin-associated ferredoxin